MRGHWNFNTKEYYLCLKSDLKQIIIIEVTAITNISTPAGRKIVREPEKHKKQVKITYPIPESFAENITYNQQEFEDKVKEKFAETYGVNLKEV